MIDPSLFRLIPPLRRARGDRLYGPDGRHWVDLWKQDGVWLLGHRPEGAAKEWKIQVDKGLALWAPSPWADRLALLVRRLVPGAAAVRVFRNADRAPQVPLWRPWDDASVELSGTAARLVLPTGPGQAVAVAFGSAWSEPLPEHDVTSPVEAATLVHAAAQLLRFEADDNTRRARRVAGETFDRKIGSANFERRGLWIFPRNTADYGALFRRHFDAGFVLNPDPQLPSLLPTALSDGEWAAWAKAQGGE